YHGPMVEKSNVNYAHDGRVVEGPLGVDAVRPERVYQKAIDNRIGADGLVLDHRVVVHGEEVPLVYLKYRPEATRFSAKNGRVELKEADALVSEEELARLKEMARRMGVDYGEMDVLRDTDHRIYVVDVNNTPAGPPNGLPLAECRRALGLLAASYTRLLE